MAEARQAPMVGASVHTIDKDGRFIIPQRMRSTLGTSFYLTRGVEKCLWILPEHIFTELMSQILAGEQPYLDRDSRRLSWRFIGQAIQVEPDKQFRIVIPPELRESSGLRGEVVAMGLGDRVEIWNIDKWFEADSNISDDDIQEILDRKILKLETKPEAEAPQEETAEAVAVE